MSDLISRQNAIDAWDKLSKRGRTEFDQVLMSLPSAKSKTGKWIDRSEGGRILFPWWESCGCDQCGCFGSGAWDFCPNCGARMKGADDE